MLPSVFPRLATGSAGRVFPGAWKPLFLKFPSRDGLPFPRWSSLPTSFVSFFTFYIFSYLFLKTMICFSGCLMSSTSIQKLFCEVCSALKCSFEESVREKLVSPSYSSAILGPTSGSFQMSQLFTSGGQSFGVSASTSVLPMNTQGWSPLGWTGWIFLQS